MMIPRFLARLLVFAFVMLTAACASQPPAKQLYLLGQVANTPAAPQPGAAAPNVALARVSTAGFLDTSGIVYQTGENEIAVAARNLWAEPLPDQLRRVFYARLAQYAQAVNLFADTQSAPARSVRLAIEFTGFHGRQDGRAVVAGVWSLADAQNQNLLRQPFNYRVALQSDGYGELVGALEQGLDAAAKDIAVSLNRFAASRAGQ